jgi:hypothetical protein
MVAACAFGGACGKARTSTSATTTTTTTTTTTSANTNANTSAAEGSEGAEGDEADAVDAGASVEKVTIKVIVDQKRQAHVWWGRKDFGVAPLEIVRPKSSGPLDLQVLAPGCLPLHTRVFTDHDEKIALRLYSESEAPGLLGYRASERPNISR